MTHIDLSRRVYEGADYISGRDLYARQRELEDERGWIADRLANARIKLTEAEVADNGDLFGEAAEEVKNITQELKDWDDDDDLGGELARLVAIKDEYSLDDELIADHEFEEHARQLAEDIGAVSSDSGWPMDYIDWERAADALKADYGSLVYGSTTYWVRQ